METLRLDLKHALRLLLAQRSITAIAVLTLAMGIGVNTTVFTMLKGIALRPLPGVRAADDLVVLLTTSRSGERGPMNFHDYLDVRDRSRTLAGVAGTFPVAMTIGRGDAAERVWGELATGNLFRVLGVSPLVGRLITEDDDRGEGAPVAAISYALWQRKYHGDPGIIGQPLQVGAWNAAWGDMHLGPENALKAVSILDPKTFLPIHWGTFRLAMHEWDQPAEVLFNQASTIRAQLVMPRLGEPIEPAAASGRVEPWWRGVDGVDALMPPVDSGSTNSKLPRAMPWPID